MNKVEERSRIFEFYKGKSIFITGGTGFLGKVLIEKLLRSCNDLNKLYLLIRTKKQKAPSERTKELLQNKIFDRLRENHIDFVDKIICIPGDLKQEKLGLSPWHHQLIVDHVSIIFHLGASIRFDENLKNTLMNNFYSTKNIIDLAKEIKKLEALVHISTAYCNIYEKCMYEKINPTIYPTNKILDCLKWMNDETFECLKKTLVNHHPNNYTYSKCLAEQLLKEEGSNLPVIIIRPSVIIPALKEPQEGWIDVWNSPVAITIAFGMGCLRVFRLFLNNIYDVVPVDICANTAIASAWFYTNQKHKESIVYHCTTSVLNPVRNHEVVNLGLKLVDKYPLSQAYRYPKLTIVSNQCLYEVCKLFLHYFPAAIVDGFRIILRKKPVLVSLYKKIHLKFEQMNFYIDKEWKFDVSNYKKLIESLSDEDKQKFYCDPRDIKWMDYIEMTVNKNRLYFMNEDEDNLPQARKHLFKLYCIELAVKVTLTGIFLYLLPSELWISLSNIVCNMF